MGTIDQPDFPGYTRGKQGTAQAETKLSFVKPSIILYCPHLVPDASLLTEEIRSETHPQRITEQRRLTGCPTLCCAVTSLTWLAKQCCCSVAQPPARDAGLGHRPRAPSLVQGLAAALEPTPAVSLDTTKGTWAPSSFRKQLAHFYS